MKSGCLRLGQTLLVSPLNFGNQYYLQDQECLKYRLCKTCLCSRASTTVAKPKYLTTLQQPTKVFAFSHAKEQNADLKTLKYIKLGEVRWHKSQESGCVIQSYQKGGKKKKNLLQSLIHDVMLQDSRTAWLDKARHPLMRWWSGGRSVDSWVRGTREHFKVTKRGRVWLWLERQGSRNQRAETATVSDVCIDRWGSRLSFGLASLS